MDVEGTVITQPEGEVVYDDDEGNDNAIAQEDGNTVVSAAYSKTTTKSLAIIN